MSDIVICCKGKECERPPDERDDTCVVHELDAEIERLRGLCSAFERECQALEVRATQAEEKDDKLIAEYEAEIERLKTDLGVLKQEAADVWRLRADNERLRQLVKTLTDADPRHDLAAEIERLQAELSRWHLDAPAYANVLLAEENNALIAENEQLKEELEMTEIEWKGAEIKRLNDLIFRQRAALQLIGGMIENHMKHGGVLDFTAAAQMIERVLNNRAENDGPK